MKNNLIKDKRVKDLIYTLGANTITLLIGVIVTFIIPKVISIDEYGYFKMFTFYLGFLGFFHLGFNDGIYVNYGDYDYENIPREKFRTYFKFLLIFQVLIAVLVTIGTMSFVENPEKRIICFFLALNIILLNLTCYFEFLSQIIRRFKFYSFNTILSKILYIVAVSFILLLKYEKAIYLIIAQTIINLLTLLIYIIYYREVNFGKYKPLITMKEDIKKNIKIGFFIMLGNFVSIIIIGVDRIFISKFFTVHDFAMYSFAVSLLSMIYILLNGIRSVIYPYLTRSSEKNLNKTYETMKTYIFIILGYALSSYFIFEIIVLGFLPKYKEVLYITPIIFPTVLLSGEINIVTSNFYKSLKLEKEYTRNNLIAVAVSLISIVIAFLVFRSKEAIATSSLLSFYIWELCGDGFFKKHLGIKVSKHHIAEILVIVLFLYLSFKMVWYKGFILYLCGFTLIVLIFFKNEIKGLFEKRR